MYKKTIFIYKIRSNNNIILIKIKEIFLAFKETIQFLYRNQFKNNKSLIDVDSREYNNIRIKQ